MGKHGHALMLGLKGEESAGPLIKMGQHLCFMLLQAVFPRVDGMILRVCGFPGNQVSLYRRTLPLVGCGGSQWHHGLLGLACGLGLSGLMAVYGPALLPVIRPSETRNQGENSSPVPKNIYIAKKQLLLRLQIQH